MQISFGPVSARALVGALVLSGTTLVLVAGCGGGDSSPSPNAGSGGDAGDNGEGGSSAAGKGGKGGAGKSGAPTVDEAGAGGELNGEGGAGGAGGEIGALTPAQNNSAVAFVASGRISKSKNFILISGLGESLGGTVGSKQSKSLKYTYIPGVIAASSP
jgi:hypothetical protein